MAAINIANLILWGIAGMLVLCSKKVTKIQYGLAWSVLMVELIGDLIISCM